MSKNLKFKIGDELYLCGEENPYLYCLGVPTFKPIVVTVIQICERSSISERPYSVAFKEPYNGQYWAEESELFSSFEEAEKTAKLICLKVLMKSADNAKQAYNSYLNKLDSLYQYVEEAFGKPIEEIDDKIGAYKLEEALKLYFENNTFVQDSVEAAFRKMIDKDFISR